MTFLNPIPPRAHDSAPTSGVAAEVRLRRSCRRSMGACIPTAAGFSIVEIMVVITIISLLGALAIPRVKTYQNSARAAVIASNLRTFAAAFEGYSQENGEWPAETAAGEIPAEMAGRLGTSAWLQPSPMGGQYNWENNQTHGGVKYRAAICISESATAPLEVNADMLLAIDRLMDDGNLSTGNFRTGVNDDPLFILLP